ncbi:dienelactone hydrolase family protein [Metapseudomonas resinovorans]|uniref:Putative hydrolase n=1 Tax=Metapseudomonas resinovorans NBRC 106553 TaxID=1245471 RepID=S6AQ85_METRE|nr:dienelactone hydrolase family protein [Pseudomonas resinovorans]BAN47913.1 putative hydrolase [Pseudomonas resinovorans NBRC 106553]
MNRLLLSSLLFAMAGPTWAAMVTQAVPYEIDGKAFQGTLVYDDAVKTPRPGLLMVPNWLGVTPAAAEQAKVIAGERYVIFIADMYGKDVRPSNPDEAKAAATAVRGDRPLMRKRAQAGVETLKAQGSKVALDQANLGAIGFCFGGGSVLELARAGAPLKGFVSFHGNLDTPDPADARNIRAPVLVLHGADDPSVPKAQVDAFTAEMTAAKADWQLVSYGGAVHSFTDPDAKVPGRNEYHPKVAARAYQAMNDLFDEVFTGTR